VDPVAIIGLSCRFPGGRDEAAFWRSLERGVDSVSEFPPDRAADRALFFDELRGRGTLREPYAAGFIEDIRSADLSALGFSAGEAAALPHRHRLALEATSRALEDARVSIARVRGARAGLFAGTVTGDFGPSGSSAAQRVAAELDLQGPCVVTDTVCSSSLVALHVACQSLLSGESDPIAIILSVNVIQHPALDFFYVAQGVASAGGRCRPFDAGADGIVRAEGAAAIVVKPLERALRDGDRVRAVLLGSAVNQNGRGNGVLAPNRWAQERVVRDACARAGLTPSAIQYVEAHGTGTHLGDPIEANALGAVMQDRKEPCIIGSVKSNFGHLEATAGMGSLVKVVLALEHRQVPASLHYDAPNPHIPFGALPLAVQKETGPWPDPGSGPLVAGVTCLGMGGTNAHVVLRSVA
jgi:acyl transferase domain-containing protein